MIELSISSYSLKDLPFERMLATLSRIGFARLELVAFGRDNTPDLRQWEGPALQGAMGAYGLMPVALYTQAMDVHKEKIYEESLRYIEHAIDVAVAMNVRRIVFTPLLPREGYHWERLVEGCLRLCGYIGERDVRICLENHAGWPLSIAEDFARVLGEVPDRRIGITMDTGHFTAAGQDLLAFVERFGERIAHVHLKDHVGKRCVPLGSGETDNKGVLAALRARGYDGYATLEVEVADKENTERYLDEAKIYCARELMLP